MLPRMPFVEAKSRLNRAGGNIRRLRRGRTSWQQGLLSGALCVVGGLAPLRASAGTGLNGADREDGATETEPAISALDASNAQIGPGFVYLPDASAAVACAPRSIARKAIAVQVASAQRALDLDVQLAIVIATHPVGCGDLFYLPFQNDIGGIGYAHTDGVEVFDEDPETRLEGIVFLNNMLYWESHRDEFRTAFLHEVGHRWGARVGARRGQQELVLTGREAGHWSYFLDSGGSPLEGNRFEPLEPLTTATPALRLDYSRLDLYLMGLIEPEEVGPIRLLVGATVHGVDCRGNSVTAMSPPQICEPKALNGAWIEVGIEDVIAKEGKRTPASAEAPRALTAAVFVFDNSTGPWPESSCTALRDEVTARFDDFAQATGARMQLINAVGVQGACADLAQRKAAPIGEWVGGGCSMTRGPTRGPCGLARCAMLFWVALLGLRWSCRQDHRPRSVRSARKMAYAQ